MGDKKEKKKRRREEKAKEKEKRLKLDEEYYGEKRKSAQEVMQEIVSLSTALTELQPITIEKQAPVVKFKVRPQWMKNRQEFESDIFEQKPLSVVKDLVDPQLLKNLELVGIKTLFPVQLRVLPALLQRNPFVGDCMVCSPTGSGKTYAYAIPLLQKVLQGVLSFLRAIVMVPTNELAEQVLRVFLELTPHTRVKVEMLESFEKAEASGFPQSQWKMDILIATPTSILDYLSRGLLPLTQLETLVLDEVDQLLKTNVDGYREWLPTVIAAAHSSSSSTLQLFPPDSHGSQAPVPVSPLVNVREIDPLRVEATGRPLGKWCFSATLTQNPAKLASLHLRAPQFFSPPGGTQLPESLLLYEVRCQRTNRMFHLYHLIATKKVEKALCFCNSLEMTHAVFLFLTFMQLPVAEYSSNISVSERKALVDGLRSGVYQM